MLVWSRVLFACREEPPAVIPEGRVLEGPSIGAAVAVHSGQLWVSAPGLEGEGGVYRFDGTSGRLSNAPLSIVSPEPGAVGGAFAVCDLDSDASDDVVIGAPARDGRGGVWWVRDPGAAALGTSPFVAGIYDDGHSGFAVACGLIGDQTVVAISAPDTDGLGVAVAGGSIGLHIDEGSQVDKIGNLETSWSDSHLGSRTALVAGEDFDGDGVGDLAVGASGADRVHLLFGPLAGSYEASTAGPILIGEDGEGTAHSLSAGDIDGDGTVDLVAGTPLALGEAGGFWLVPGPFGDDSPLLRTVARKRSGVQAGDQAGFAVSVVPDIDGAGTDEILVGAPFAGGVGDDAGAAYLVMGPAGGDGNLDSADAIFLGDVALGKLGWSVAAGDLGADGSVEIVVGAPEADAGDAVGVGVVYVFPGSLRGVHYPQDALGQVER